MAERKASKKPAKTKAKNDNDMHPLAYEIIGLIFIAFAVIEFFEFGIVGRIIHSIAMFLFGNLHVFIPFLCSFYSWYVLCILCIICICST